VSADETTTTTTTTTRPGAALAAAAPEEPKAKRSYRKTGEHSLRRALNARGIDGLDGRTALARLVNDFRASVASDLGGDLSAAQHALLDRASARLAILLVVEEALATNPAWIVNRKKRALTALAREHSQLTASFEAAMERLGLERKAKEIPSLIEYQRQRQRERGQVSRAES